MYKFILAPFIFVILKVSLSTHNTAAEWYQYLSLISCFCLLLDKKWQANIIGFQRLHAFRKFSTWACSLAIIDWSRFTLIVALLPHVA